MSKTVYYGSKPLKKNQRRPSMKEAVEAGQVAWFGVHKVDPRMIETHASNKKKGISKDKYLEKVMTRRGAMARIKKIEEEMSKPYALSNEKKMAEFKNEIRMKMETIKQCDKVIEEYNNQKQPVKMPQKQSHGIEVSNTIKDLADNKQLRKVIEEKLPIVKEMPKKNYELFMANVLSTLKGDDNKFNSTKGEYDFWSKQIEKSRLKKPETHYKLALEDVINRMERDGNTFGLTADNYVKLVKTPQTSISKLLRKPMNQVTGYFDPQTRPVKAKRVVVSKRKPTGKNVLSIDLKKFLVMAKKFNDELEVNARNLESEIPEEEDDEDEFATLTNIKDNLEGNYQEIADELEKFQFKKDKKGNYIDVLFKKPFNTEEVVKNIKSTIDYMIKHPNDFQNYWDSGPEDYAILKAKV